MRVLRSLAIATLLPLALGACSMFDPPEPTNVKPVVPKPLDMKSSSLQFPFNRTLVAVAFKDQEFRDDRPTLLVTTNNRGTGFSACNNWSATVMANPNQRFLVGPVAISKRKCTDRLMHNEQVFLYVMRTAQRWTFDGQTLTLAGPYGTMTFRSAT